ncbi:MAG: hypothetical protein M3R51_06560 [Candidatus Eremiobacteraeota bacterium]|nr:hypothetical protein [Candidatus Eremiobacteraeota bacterium]
MRQDAAAANGQAIELRRQGKLPESIGAFRDAIALFPREIALHQNLAHALYESGDTPQAIVAHERALMLDPRSVSSHLALYELLQITGERKAALEHQREAFESQRLFSHAAPNEKRSVLLLCAPGDWQANIPVDFLLDRSTTSAHKLYLIDAVHLQRDTIPPHDVVWNAIAESPDAAPYLSLAESVFSADRKPRLNEPARVLATARLLLPQTLGASGAIAAPTTEIPRESLERGEVPFALPVIVRPVGSHAGMGLEKIGMMQEFAAYALRVEAQRYFVSPFIDYSSADGLFRKYRIVFVDGEPYPVHLAISPKWMIHYYNAPMSENLWMRNEEAAFLENLRRVFDGSIYDVLLAIARAVRLEYFGIDCAITRDNRVLVFEADPAMLVHTSDPVELYPYKHQYVPRIYRALERMIDAVKVADT